LVIPGGRLESGLRILVSYLAEALPSSQYSTLNARMGFNISYRGFQFTYSSSKTDYKLKYGPADRFLDDRSESSAIIRYQHNFSKADVSIGLERRSYQAGSFKNTSLGFSQGLSYAVNPRTSIDLHMSELSAKYSDTSRERVYQLRLSLTWRSNLGVILKPQLGLWQRKQTGELDGLENDLTDQFLSAGINVRWVYNRLNFELDLLHNARDANGSKNQYDSVHFNLRRRFW
jgi:hypothetical protein